MSSDVPLSSPALVVDVENLGKCYDIYERPHHRLLEALTRHRKKFSRRFWALRNVSFQLAKGETVGILGQNGSGKSTLLQLVAGTLTPTEGSATVHGRVAALLELGSGFNPEFTGRENVFFAGCILGIAREEMARRFEAITQFAAIGDFIDQPVKTYSSGMGVRLAFSVAINVDPDVLIVDEALSVGDARFQQRCMTRIRELQQKGVSILFVSHDTDACKRLCNRVYILEKGSVINHGNGDEMANWYLAYLTSLDNSSVTMYSAKRELASAAGMNATPLSPGEPSPSPDDSVSRQSAPNGTPHEGFTWFRHGDGNANIERCELLDGDGKPVDFAYMDERYTIRFHLRFQIALPTAILGFFLKDRLGTDLYGINTFQEETPFPAVEPGSRVSVSFTLPMLLRPGYYSVSPGLAYNQHEMRYLDYVDHALIFKVVDRNPRRTVFGLFHPDTEVTIETLHPKAPESWPSGGR